jgi:hypothetical protein
MQSESAGQELPYGLSIIGVFRHGPWFSDCNSNGLWDGCDIDGCIVRASRSGERITSWQLSG